MPIHSTILKYATDSPRQVVKRYEITKPHLSVEGKNLPTHNFIMIHGGAWRDDNNTCADYDQFVEYFQKFTQKDAKVGNILVYSIDYELSNKKLGRFPDVLIDVLKALDTIYKDAQGVATSECSFTIVGHSVGSTFITQILEFKNIFKSINLEQPHFQLPNITKAVFLDGIFNIKLLLDEYPSYEFFVVDEFGTRENAIKNCNSVGVDNVRDTDVIENYQKLDKILIVHSSKDELLSFKQPDDFIDWLDAIEVEKGKIERVYSDFGVHNDVYINEDVAKLIFQF